MTAIQTAIATLATDLTSIINAGVAFAIVAIAAEKGLKYVRSIF